MATPIRTVTRWIIIAFCLAISTSSASSDLLSSKRGVPLDVPLLTAVNNTQNFVFDGETRWFKVNLTKGHGYTFYILAHLNAGYLNLALYNQDLVLMSQVQNIDDSTYGRVSRRASLSGTYYLRVQGSSSARGNFDLGMYPAWFNPGVQDRDRALNLDSYTALYLQPGVYELDVHRTYSYRFRTEKDGQIMIDVKPTLNSGDVNIYLYDRYGRELLRDLDVTASSPGRLQFQFRNSDVFFLTIWAPSASTRGTFEIEVEGLLPEGDQDGDRLSDSQEHFWESNLSQRDSDRDSSDDYLEALSGNSPVYGLEWSASTVREAVTRQGALGLPVVDRFFRTAMVSNELWIRLEAQRGQGLAAALRCYFDYGDVNFELYDSTGNRLVYDFDVGDGDRGLLQFLFQIEGTYYLRINAARPNLGYMDVGVFHAWFNEGTSGENHELFANRFSAVPLLSSQRIDLDDFISDYFYFEAKSGDAMQALFSPHLNDGDLEVYMYDEDGGELARVLDIANGTSRPLTFDFAAGGTFYIRVIKDSNDRGYYDLSVQGIDLQDGVSNDVFVDIPDPNFKACLVRRHDADGDREISEAEAATVTSILCTGQSITSLAGIDAFSALESLVVAENQLATIPDLSALTSLVTLDLSNNELSGLPALPDSITTLNLDGNRFQTVPTFSNLVNLDQLDLRNNLLNEDDCDELLSLASQGLSSVLFSPQFGSVALDCDTSSTTPAINILRPTIQDRISVRGLLLSELRGRFEGTRTVTTLRWQNNRGGSGPGHLLQTKADNPLEWAAFDIPLQPGQNLIVVEALVKGQVISKQLEVFAGISGDIEPPQIVAFKYPKIANANGTYSYTIEYRAGTNPVSRVEWDFAGRDPYVPVNSSVQLHSFEDPGTYQVRAVVFDSENFTSDAIGIVRVVAINQPPEILAFQIVDDVVNVGEPAEFQVIATDADLHPLTYLWVFNDGSVRRTRNSQVSHAFARPGTYDVSVQVTDGQHFDEAMLTVDVLAINHPAIDLSPDHFDKQICLLENNRSTRDIIINNSGGGALDYRTDVSYLTETPLPWVTVLNGGQGVVVAGNNPAKVTIELQNTNQLPGGRYRANLVFFSPNDQVVPVSFELVLDVDDAPCETNKLSLIPVAEGRVNASWSFNQVGIKDFQIQLYESNREQPLTPFTTKQSSWVFSGLEPNRHYRVEVQARNTGGVMSSTEKWVKTLAAEGLGFVTYFDHVAQNHDFWTGLALVNPYEEPVAASLIARDRDGTVLSEVSGSFNPGQKILGTVDFLFSNYHPDTKSMELLSSKALDTLELFGAKNSLRMTGLPTGAFLKETAHILLGACTNTGPFATFGMYNPSGTLPVTVEAEGFDQNGRLLGTGRIQLLPKQQTAFCVDELINGAPDGLSWFRLKANGPFSGFNLWGQSDDHLNGDSFQGTGSLQTFIPRVEPGSRVYLANPNAASITVELIQYDYGGSEVGSIPTVVLGSLAFQTLSINHSGSIWIDASGPVLVMSDLVRLGPGSSTTDLYSEAVPAQSRFYNALMVPHVARSTQFRTEIFIANLGFSSSPLFIDAYSADGRLIAQYPNPNGSQGNISIPAKGGWQVDVGTLFPGLDVAYLKVLGKADSRFIGQGLFSTKNAGQMGGFLLPPLNLSPR